MNHSDWIRIKKVMSRKRFWDKFLLWDKLRGDKLRVFAQWDKLSVFVQWDKLRWDKLRGDKISVGQIEAQREEKPLLDKMSVKSEMPENSNNHSKQSLASSPSFDNDLKKIPSLFSTNIKPTTNASESKKASKKELKAMKEDEKEIEKEYKKWNVWRKEVLKNQNKIKENVEWILEIFKKIVELFKTEEKDKEVYENVFISVDKLTESNDVLIGNLY
uniref:Uncharacterized protein n=1 Tax=Meloidogyne hapla TaxID=6305 RepID=A0A1I8BDS9_MELHA